MKPPLSPGFKGIERSVSTNTVGYNYNSGYPQSGI